MRNNKIIYKDEKYYLNKNQYFIMDKKKASKRLKEVQFPVLIMDTEFFNRSHDRDDLPKRLYTDDNPDLIYVMCFSIANSYNDLLNRNNSKSISTLYVRKKIENTKFNFTKQMDKMLKEFVNICISKKIKTLVFAGKDNDVKILTNWINNNKSILNNKDAPLFIHDKKSGKISINSYDIYQVLGEGLSFANILADGTEYYEPKNLKKGNKGVDTIQLPSLKHFFTYFGNYYDRENFEESREIYELCVDALKFYTLTFTNVQKFNELNNSVKEARDHCFNDVLKLLYVISFIYMFATKEDEKNKYINTKESEVKNG